MGCGKPLPVTRKPTLDEHPARQPRAKRRRNASGSARIEWRVEELGFVLPPALSVQEQLDRYPRNAIPYFRTFSVDVLPHLQNGDVFPSLTRSGTRSPPCARQIDRRSGVMVKDGGSPARATSIGPRAATGIFANAAGGNPRDGVKRRGGNNDRLSTLWREVISLAGVARSLSESRGPISLWIRRRDGEAPATGVD